MQGAGGRELKEKERGREKEDNAMYLQGSQSAKIISNVILQIITSGLISGITKTKTEFMQLYIYIYI